MNLDDVATMVSRIEADQEILSDQAIEERAAALNTLAFLHKVIGARRRSHTAHEKVEQLDQRVDRLRARLASVDRRLFEELRSRIRAHTISRRELRRCFSRYTGYKASAGAYRHLGLEPLDHLVTGILYRDPPPVPSPLGSGEMVAYQPTPTSLVLELIDNLTLSPDDCFCDIGAGLGKVVHLVGLLTDCCAYGIEIDAGLAAYASTVARDLNLMNVSFVNADARQVDLSDATVYYLFTPFLGKLLTTVMARLRGEAARRRIRICGYGPITPYLASLPWLAGLNNHGADEFRLAVFQSR